MVNYQRFSNLSAIFFHRECWIISFKEVFCFIMFTLSKAWLESCLWLFYLVITSLFQTRYCRNEFQFFRFEFPDRMIEVAMSLFQPFKLKTWFSLCRNILHSIRSFWKFWIKILSQKFYLLFTFVFASLTTFHQNNLFSVKIKNIISE